MHRAHTQRRWTRSEEPEFDRFDTDEDPAGSRLRELRERGERRERSRQRELKRGFTSPRGRRKPSRETWEA